MKKNEDDEDEESGIKLELMDNYQFTDTHFKPILSQQRYIQQHQEDGTLRTRRLKNPCKIEKLSAHKNMFTRPKQCSRTTF